LGKISTIDAIFPAGGLVPFPVNRRARTPVFHCPHTENAKTVPKEN